MILELSSQRGSAQAAPPLSPNAGRNIRVLDAIPKGQSGQDGPRLEAPVSSLSAEPIPGVELRLHFDIEAIEKGSPRHIFYNFRDVAIDAATAATTLQIAYWVLEENAVAPPFKGLQYVDLKTAKVHSIARQSQKALRLMKANAKIIQTLWPTI